MCDSDACVPFAGRPPLQGPASLHAARTCMLHFTSPLRVLLSQIEQPSSRTEAQIALARPREAAQVARSRKQSSGMFAASSGTALYDSDLDEGNFAGQAALRTHWTSQVCMGPVFLFALPVRRRGHCHGNTLPFHIMMLAAIAPCGLSGAIAHVHVMNTCTAVSQAASARLVCRVPAVSLSVTAGSKLGPTRCQSAWASMSPTSRTRSTLQLGVTRPFGAASPRRLDASFHSTSRSSILLPACFPLQQATDSRGRHVYRPWYRTCRLETRLAKSSHLNLDVCYALSMNQNNWPADGCDSFPRPPPMSQAHCTATVVRIIIAHGEFATRQANASLSRRCRSRWLGLPGGCDGTFACS